MISSIHLDKNNAEQQMAYDIIANTNQCLFITGKAGTGKTTFIKQIQKEIKKNFVIVAPTGVAAIAAGGRTMHSFFGFPLEVIGPYTDLFVPWEKKMLIEHTDAIIVDEASMARSDMVDGMDRYLQMACDTYMPFGGKQIIFVGDLYQLPPVVKKWSEDEDMLMDIYGKGTPFFYKANVFKRTSLLKIEFQKIYRQTDIEFIDILNKMRVGKLNRAELSILNKNINSNNNVGDFSVILTAYNKIAAKINNSKLASINDDEFIYEGIIKGEFKSKDCPVPEILKLKVGAQVIFCRNEYKLGCINGTIAKVIELDNDTIKVQLESGKIINVIQEKWEIYDRVYDNETRRMESKIVGSYTQYPLKLAWAITIHKSQGMTFDRMHLDLTRGLFAEGQAYVAISRMRSLSGLTLSQSLRLQDIMVNQEVIDFARSFNEVQKLGKELEIGRAVYKYLSTKDYNMASQLFLKESINRIRQWDYLNAELLVKQMFDIMLDDECLINMTSGVRPIHVKNITCAFLNSIIYLYSKQYNEAIRIADLILLKQNILDVRSRLDVMYIKAHALYALGHYSKALEIHQEIMNLYEIREGFMHIDKKQYLLETKINCKLGNSIFKSCSNLNELCPEYIIPYNLIRNEMIQKKIKLKMVKTKDKSCILAKKFNDFRISEKKFLILLNESDTESDEFGLFKHLILSSISE